MLECLVTWGVRYGGRGPHDPELPHCRLLEEESSKRAELERWHLEQQQAIETTEAEKQELENQRIMKERALQEAMAQLEQLELERKQALEQYEVTYKENVHLDG